MSLDATIPLSKLRLIICLLVLLCVVLTLAVLVCSPWFPIPSSPLLPMAHGLISSLISEPLSAPWSGTISSTFGYGICWVPWIFHQMATNSFDGTFSPSWWSGRRTLQRLLHADFTSGSHSKSVNNKPSSPTPNSWPEINRTFLFVYSQRNFSSKSRVPGESFFSRKMFALLGQTVKVTIWPFPMLCEQDLGSRFLPQAFTDREQPYVFRIDCRPNSPDPPADPSRGP